MFLSTAAIGSIEALSKFKISFELLENAGVRRSNDFDERGLPGVHGRKGQDLGGIVFPIRDPRDGGLLGHTVRLEHAVRAWIGSRLVGQLRLGRTVRIPYSEIDRPLQQGAVPARAVRDN